MLGCCYFKQKTADERRISDWSSDVCASNLPDMMAQIKAAGERKIRATKPTLSACSDPVALGLFMNWDQRSATIDKTRGGVYDYDGIKVIIVTPITALNRQYEGRIIKDERGGDNQREP